MRAAASDGASTLVSLCWAQLITDWVIGRRLYASRVGALCASLALSRALSLHSAARSSAGAASPDAALALAPLIWLVATGVIAGMRPPFRPRHAAMAALFPAAAWLLRARWAPSLAVAARWWLLAAAHLAACFADCRRAAGGAIGALDFFEALCEALAYVAPVYPVLALAASATLLFLTSLLALLGLSPETFRWLVLWGAAHAPFWCVHLRARQMLPRAAGRTVGARGATRSLELPLPLVAEPEGAARVARRQWRWRWPP